MNTKVTIFFLKFSLLIFIFYFFVGCRTISQVNKISHNQNFLVEFKYKVIAGTYDVQTLFRVVPLVPDSTTFVFVDFNDNNNFNFMGKIILKEKEKTFQDYWHYKKPGIFSFKIMISNQNGDVYYTDYNIKTSLLCPIVDSDISFRGITNQKPLISWSRVPYARKYRIQVALGSDFNNLVYNKRVPFRFFRIRRPLTADQYYSVRIKGINNKASAFYSTPVRFAVLSVKTSEIPAVKFKMGKPSNVDGAINEEPVHSVELDKYFIDRYEVNNWDYALFLNTINNSNYYHIQMTNSNNSGICFNGVDYSVVKDRKNFPVVYVSYFDALAYADWRSARLPTEAEWEYAARGENYIDYTFKNLEVVPFGENVSNVYAVDSFSEGKSKFGLYNVCGNVWEWTADWYDNDYYKYGNVVNPSGELNDNTKVIRGGAVRYPKEHARLTFRDYEYPAVISPFLGFRCVMSAHEE